MSVDRREPTGTALVMDAGSGSARTRQGLVPKTVDSIRHRDHVLDPQAKTVLTKELKHDRLQRGPALTPSEVSEGFVEIFNGFRSGIY